MKDNEAFNLSELFFGMAKDEQKFFDLFDYIKNVIYSNYSDLPEIKEMLSLRRDFNASEIVALEYFIGNDTESGIIYNEFIEDKDVTNVTTTIVTFKDNKLSKNKIWYSCFYKENGKDYFKIYTFKDKIFVKKEIKKEEIDSKKL